MSYLIRWVRQNQSLASRSFALIGRQQRSLVNNPQASPLMANQAIKPLYLISTAPFKTAPPPPPPNQHDPPKKYGKETTSSEIKDTIEYKIKFKEGMDVKKIFKQFYSLYGPLFVACHISISLASLGFFCSLVWLTVDLTKILPDILLSYIGQTMTTMTEGGGKFFIAYAVHKLILPIRLFGAIWLTRTLSGLIKKRRALKLEGNKNKWDDTRLTKIPDPICKGTISSSANELKRPA